MNMIQASVRYIVCACTVLVCTDTHTDVMSYEAYIQSHMHSYHDDDRGLLRGEVVRQVLIG